MLQKEFCREGMVCLLSTVGRQRKGKGREERMQMDRGGVEPPGLGLSFAWTAGTPNNSEPPLFCFLHHCLTPEKECVCCSLLPLLTSLDVYFYKGDKHPALHALINTSISSMFFLGVLPPLWGSLRISLGNSGGSAGGMAARRSGSQPLEQGVQF